MARKQAAGSRQEALPDWSGCSENANNEVIKTRNGSATSKS